MELQNGCLSLAHSNLFIPSNLNGSCFDPETGQLDHQRLQANMDLATDIYIRRCDGAPCGSASIHLFKGANSSTYQELSTHVLTFLKGSQTQKEQLMQEKSEVYRLIEKVWQVRQRHMVKGLPSQYAFYLKCCLDEKCFHPLPSGSAESTSSWFPGGPSVTYFPFLVPDPSQPWGNPHCSKCEGQCWGHFLDPKTAILHFLP